ncbi:hypothetical protein H4R33_002855 [Dimargaris cristalligena]|uniref:Uncharacterized protein n=1 Tax=Dimargaris cristalligena TaxID=215637 RepID=A0A4Q0A047_9FUNG|nr:hypothetical protein H4R33_002855 [Dimargaris cristalligena]RKP38791.1 hypothetical protein BJ085DRAFT_30457 [Dimargaris cristalligena]|eukprot:RKP38791.1 hypothetical protein BJ085DRAFT_30457 [Dimargaris cristalligena]
MFKLTYLLLTLPAIGLLTSTVLGSPVPSQGYQSDGLGTFNYFLLVGDTGAEIGRRCEEAGIEIPYTFGDRDAPSTKLAHRQLEAMIQAQQQNQKALPNQTEDVLDEIRGASIITGDIQTRFWNYVRQPELTSVARQAIKEFAGSFTHSQTEQLLNEFLLGSVMSVQVKKTDTGVLADSSLQHNVFPGLFRLGNSELAMSLLAPAQTMVQLILGSSSDTDDSYPFEQALWVFYAWQTQLNWSIKVLAIKGDMDSLTKLWNMEWSQFLKPNDIFTSAMWAFWFNQPMATKFLMEKVKNPHQLVPSLRKLHAHLLKWSNATNADTREKRRTVILAKSASSFNSGLFFDEFALPGLMDSPIEESREAILDAMENQLTFSFTY